MAPVDQEPLRRHTDTDPEQVEWWTSLPDLVRRLEQALRDAATAIKELRQGRDFNRKLIASSVIFNVAVMLFFGYLFDQRDQQRRDDILAVRGAFYDQCVDINQNAMTINEFIAAQIQSVRTSPVRTPAEKARMIAGYERLRQAVPKCIPPTRRLIP